MRWRLRANIAAWERAAPDVAAWRRWRLAAGVVTAGTVALLLLFRETAAGIVETWESSAAFNHGYIILPVTAFLVWRARHSLAAAVPRATFWGVPLMAAFAGAWLLGEVFGFKVVREFALVGMVQALIFTTLGWRATRPLIFPLSYLYFAVPFGAFLIPPLQLFTADFVVRGLQIFGFPVFLDGVLIAIPSGTFEVAAACAGLRFLTASVALGYLCAGILYRSFWRRAAFMALAVVVPIIANGFRALGIILLAHYSDYRIAAGVDHVIYGWIFFSLVTMVLLAIGMTFRETPEAGPKPAPAAATAAPGSMNGALRGVTAGILAVATAAAGPSLLAYADSRQAVAARISLPAPAVAAPWRARPAASGDSSEYFSQDWRPVFPGADAELLRTYVAEDRRVDLYIAYYTHQRQGAEVVSAANRLGGRTRWTRMGGGTVEARIAGIPMAVPYARLRGRGRERIAWLWYWVDGKFTGDPLVAKMLQAKVRLVGGPQAAAAIVVATDTVDTPADAMKTLRRFVAGLSSLDRSLRQAGRERVSTNLAGRPDE